MAYDQASVVEAYERNARLEDVSEKRPSLRVELPREFIKKYLGESDLVLDAGGGTGINAILMARLCKKVTLYDRSRDMSSDLADNDLGFRCACSSRN